MAREIETVILGGIVKIRPAGTGLPFRDVGLVSTCQQATETQEITLTNTRADQPSFVFMADESPLHRKLGLYEVRD